MLEKVVPAAGPKADRLTDKSRSRETRDVSEDQWKVKMVRRA